MNCDMQTPVFAFPSSTFHCISLLLLYLAWRKRSNKFRRFLAMAMIKQAFIAHLAWRKR